MDLILSAIAKFFILLFSILPFRLIYIFSDILYFILYRIVRYRLDVVRGNLKLAFPEKSSQELKRIEKLTYKNLTDITVESLKAFTMSEKSIYKRHKVINENELKHLYKNKTGIIALPNHYGNWEWGAMSCMQLKWKGEVLYKPLSNKHLDDFIQKNRGRTGSRLSSIYQTARLFIETRDGHRNYVMAADQSPSNPKKSYWIDFMGIKTAFLHGPELYSKKYDYPVVFVDIQRVKRGYYELDLEILAENPKEYADGEITKKLATKLEEVIRKKPENWLWTHKRWKLKYEDHH